jgi:hypothetical protein
MRTSTLIWLVTACLSVPGDLFAADADERFDSENPANTVRKPVLQSPSTKVVLPKITRAELKGETVLDADQLPAVGAAKGSDRLVGGKVATHFIPKGGSPLILNFGKDHRNCFKAVIYDDAFPHWGVDSAEALAKLFVGKTVVVGGYVTQYKNDLQIVVGLPSQLLLVTP